MIFTWIVECESCRVYEGWMDWGGPPRIFEVSPSTVFPLRCPVCLVCEGWSRERDMRLVLDVCQKLVEVYGPAPILVGPFYDPENEEYRQAMLQERRARRRGGSCEEDEPCGSGEEFHITLQSPKSWVELQELDEKWWSLDLDLPSFMHAGVTSVPSVDEA